MNKTWAGANSVLRVYSTHIQDPTTTHLHIKGLLLFKVSKYVLSI